ncbi:MAG: hypothetical protein E7256_17455 [Lachnospiraceae bacterium]|nr:hypothetical protein [Lachnospiraceae bacterium]
MYTKYYYYIYGLVLESDIKFASMKEIENHQYSDVSIEIGIMPQKVKESIASGQEYVIRKDEVWFYIPDSGSYYIENGERILVEKKQQSDQNLVECFILGACLAHLLLQRQEVPIHGGANVVDNKALIIMGECGAGKSTLTTALRLDGFPVIADDISTVHIVNETAMVMPAAPRQKLCRDTAIRFGLDLHNLDYISEGKDKFAVDLKQDFCTVEKEAGVIIEICLSDQEEASISEIIGIDKVYTILNNIQRKVYFDAVGVNPVIMKKVVKIASTVRMYRILRPKGKETLNEIKELLLDKVK